MRYDLFLLEKLIKNHNGIYAIPIDDFAKSVQIKFAKIENTFVRISDFHNHRRTIYDYECKEKVLFIMKKLRKDDEVETIAKLEVNLQSSFTIKIHTLKKLFPFSEISSENYEELPNVINGVGKFLIDNDIKHINYLRGYKFIKDLHHYHGMV